MVEVKPPQRRAAEILQASRLCDDAASERAYRAANEMLRLVRQEKDERELRRRMHAIILGAYRLTLQDIIKQS